MIKYYFISFGILLSLNCAAQKIDSLIQLANTYRVAGNYQQAIIEYKEVLSIEKNSPIANFELAYTYLNINEYHKTIKYCNRVIRVKSEKLIDALILKGSALDYMGKSKKSIRVYTSAIKRFPDTFLLHYNLGISYYNNNQLQDAKEQLVKAIEIDKLQANSHYALGFLLNDVGDRVESMMSLYFFLMLEPDSDRSVEARKLLVNLWKQNIEVDSTLPNKLKVTISPKSTDKSSNSIDLLVSAIYASNIRVNQYKKNDYELLISNTSSFFNLLGNYKKTNTDFWLNLYINFFNDLFNANQVEPFCYYISATCDDSIVNQWLETNRDRIESFSTWTNNWFLEKKKSLQIK